MAWPQEKLTVLRRVLCGLYPMQEDALRIVKDSKLDPAYVAFDRKAINTWFSILDEADKRGRVRDLIEYVLIEYPDHETLLKLRGEGDAPVLAQAPDVGQLPWNDQRAGATLEKIIGKQSALVPVSFLRIGVRRAQAVARVGFPGGYGTGFIVQGIAGDLLVTNHHVLPDAVFAKSAVAEFNYEDPSEGVSAESESFPLAPGEGFVTDTANDWTAVRVAGQPSAKWGVLALASRKPKVNDRVNIIQHPGGARKRLSYFHNLLVYAGETRLQYLTDTEPGSSGSPIFDAGWNLVGVHHSGGYVTEPGTSQTYYRNQGIHIDVVLAGLRKAELISIG
jgi:hypothetical protein